MFFKFGILITILTTILIILLHNSQYFGNYLQVIDKPDDKRKFHKVPTPLFGGPSILIVIMLYNLILYNFDISDYSLWDNIFLIAIFLIGFVDDRVGVTPFQKLLSLFIIFFIYFHFDKNLNIQILEFTSFSRKIDLGIFSNFFLSFCSLLLINALNMTDGKNGFCASIQIIILTILIMYNLNESNNFFEYGYILFLLIFLFYNFKGKVFLGDSGVHIGTFIIINKIFYSYETITIFKVEQIFILLMIPGIDMFRVFLLRLLKNKSPFEGDRKHFHHLLEKKFNNRYSITIYLTLIIFPNLFIILFPKIYYVGLFITIIAYSSIIFKLNNSYNAIK